MNEVEKEETTNQLKAEKVEISRIYKGLLKLTKDALFVLDLEYNFRETNQRGAELLGTTIEEIIGTSAYDFVPQTEQEEVKEKQQILIAGGELQTYERTIRKKDGTEFIAEMNHTLVKDESGKPLVILSALRDISERRKFEDSIMKQAVLLSESKHEIEKSEEEKIRILNSMEEHVIYYEEGMNIKWANYAAAKSVNKKQDEIIGDFCYILWAKRDSICDGCPVKKARETLKPQTKEMTTPDGRVWLVRGVPIIEDGKLKAVVEITNEITEMKKAQTNIEKLNRELEERVKQRTTQLNATNEELKTFSYSVSHDLRAPIRRIKSFMELLRKNFQKNFEKEEKFDHYLQTVIQSTNEMDNYIDGMLVLSKVNQTELQKIEIDLRKLVEDIILKNKNEYENRSINWKIENELPIIYGDPILLRYALTNVILNSIKFTQKKKLADIEIGHERTQSDDSFNVFYIKDNGIGFNMKYAQKIFTVFQRLHNEEEYQGSGIGLATVQRIIHKHHGSIWAQSTENIGTTIYFKLPKKDTVAIKY